MRHRIDSTHLDSLITRVQQQHHDSLRDSLTAAARAGKATTELVLCVFGLWILASLFYCYAWPIVKELRDGPD